MREEPFFADLEWNGRSYDDIQADGGRGWCVMEQGVALAVESHLTSSTRVTRFQSAIDARAKVTEIMADEHGGYTGAQPNEAGELMAPDDQLRKTKDDIEHAKFTGKVRRASVRLLPSALPHADARYLTPDTSSSYS